MQYDRVAVFVNGDQTCWLADACKIDFSAFAYATWTRKLGLTVFFRNMLTEVFSLFASLCDEGKTFKLRPKKPKCLRTCVQAQNLVTL